MVPDGYIVRLAVASEIGDLAAVERAAGARFGVSVPPGVAARTVSPQSLGVAQAQGRLWVALGPGGDVIGFALASFSAGRAHLEEVDVVPAHGRRGVGSALVTTVERWATAQGCGELTLTTYADVPFNAEWYAKIGFAALPDDAIDDALRRLMDAEDAAGLARSRRVAMSKRLARD
jgi:GNAT superfamily N-acetyltransferase